MSIHKHLSRRDVLRVALISGPALAAPRLALAEQCRATPHQDEGPFYLNGYDRTRSVLHNNDLTVVPSATGLPEGEIIHVTGRVTDEEGRPVKGAVVGVYHAIAQERVVNAAPPHSATER